MKQDFLSWYYEGSKTEYVQANLDMENSKLTELAQNAAIDAKKFDQTNNLSELASIFEEWISRVKIFTYYLAAAAGILGGSIAAIGVLELSSSVFSTTFKIIGGGLGIGGVGAVLLTHILIHQIKTGSDLVTKFNRELVEMPGDVRSNDRDWNLIASKFLWNRSLLSPSTHICLIILSIIRVVSKNMYGVISADLRDQVHEFAGMNAREIISRQVRRTLDGDFPSNIENRR